MAKNKDIEHELDGTPQVGNSIDWYGTKGNATFGQALSNIADSTDINEFLRGLTLDGKRMTDSQLQDLQKQLFDVALNRRSLEEQRQYDNPAAQVARLMAAGMSRDAALAALNGSGSGSGSEAAPVSSVAPSQSALNAAQTRAADASIVFGALSSLASVAQVGAQVPVFMQQAKSLGLSNNIQQKVIDGNNSTSAAHQVIQSAINSGVVKGSLSEFTTNKEAIIKAISGLAEKGYTPAEEFIQNGMQAFVDNPYTSGIAAEYYHTLADPERYMWDTFNANRAANTLNVMQGVQIDEVAAHIEALDAETKNLIQDAALKEAQERLTRFQELRGQELLPFEKNQISSHIRGINAQTRVSIAEAMNLAAMRRQINEQTRGIRQQNDATQYQLFTPLRMPDGSTRTGLSLYTRNGLYNLWYGTQEMLQTYGNKKWFNNRLNTMLQDAETLNTYSYMQNLYSNSIYNDLMNSKNGPFTSGEKMHNIFWFYNVPQVPLQSLYESPAFMGSGDNSVSGSKFLHYGVSALRLMKYAL